MSFRRNYRTREYRPSRRVIRRYGPKVKRTKKLVDGTTGLTKAERYIAAGASTAATVAQLARTVGTIMSMINVEKKYIDVHDTGITVGESSAGYLIYPLTLMSQGDGDSQRNGNQILGSDLTFTFTLSYNDTVSPDAQSVRLIIFLDKNKLDTGTLPSPAQLLESPTNPLSAINRDYSKRFVILKSKVYNLTPERPNITSKMHMKTPWHVFFDGINATNTDIAENHIYVLAYSQYVATQEPTMQFYSRFNYYDN